MSQQRTFKVALYLTNTETGATVVEATTPLPKFERLYMQAISFENLHTEDSSSFSGSPLFLEFTAPTGAQTLSFEFGNSERNQCVVPGPVDDTAAPNYLFQWAQPRTMFQAESTQAMRTKEGIHRFVLKLNTQDKVVLLYDKVHLFLEAEVPYQ
jgi:hypothetical protein